MRAREYTSDRHRAKLTLSNANGHTNGHRVTEVEVKPKPSIWKTYCICYGLPSFIVFLFNLGYVNNWSYEYLCTLCGLLFIVQYISKVVFFPRASTLIYLCISLVSTIGVISVHEYGFNVLRESKAVLNYGSVISLWSPLHSCYVYSSFGTLYPVDYSDGTRSTHQQVVSCKHNFNDTESHQKRNTFWNIFYPHQTSKNQKDSQFHSSISNGSLIELVHVNSHRMLTTHSIAGPLSKNCQEVSGYIDFGINHRAYPIWQIFFYPEYPNIRLRHFETEAFLLGTEHVLSSVISEPAVSNDLQVVAGKGVYSDQSKWIVQVL